MDKPSTVAQLQVELAELDAEIQEQLAQLSQIVRGTGLERAQKVIIDRLAIAWTRKAGIFHEIASRHVDTDMQAAADYEQSARHAEGQAEYYRTLAERTAESHQLLNAISGTTGAEVENSLNSDS